MRQMIKLVTSDGGLAFIFTDSVVSITRSSGDPPKILTLLCIHCPLVGEAERTSYQVTRAEADKIMAKVNGTYLPPMPRGSALRMREGLQRGTSAEPGSWPGAATTDSG